MSSTNDLINNALRAIPLGAILLFLGKIFYDHINLEAVLRVMKEELKRIQKRLDEEGKKDISSGHSPISEDDLEIYRSNKRLVGRIGDSDLRDKIINIYDSLGTLIKEYKKNTQYLQELIKADPRATGRYQFRQSMYKDQAAKVEDLLNDLDEPMENLCKRLEKELSKPNERFWEQQ